MTANPLLRLGIVGCGDHSHAHAAAAAVTADVRIVAACDRDVARARSWAAQYQCESAFGHISEMLNSGGLDGVILCTWPSLHAEQIRTCLAHDVRNILCEKALVTSAAEAQDIWARAQSCGANLVEGSMYRHHPAIRKLDRVLASNELGPVDSIRAAFHNFEPEDEQEPQARSSWRYRSECGGGVQYDWMHYLVDSCNHFAGVMPRRVFASASTSSNGSVIERIYGLIEYSNGVVGIIENSKRADFSNALQITGARGTLHLPIAFAIKGEVTITHSRRKPVWDFVLRDTYQIGEANAFALQLENFCQVARGRQRPLVPLRESIINAMTTEALVESARAGIAVDVQLVGL